MTRISDNLSVQRDARDLELYNKVRGGVKGYGPVVRVSLELYNLVLEIKALNPKPNH